MKIEVGKTYKFRLERNNNYYMDSSKYDIFIFHGQPDCSVMVRDFLKITHSDEILFTGKVIEIEDGQFTKTIFVDNTKLVES